MPRKLTESVKKQVAYRQKYLCARCNILLPSRYEVDHLIPHSVSKDDSESNLEALCPNCHGCKTQREHLRILQYKKEKKKIGKDENLCWFCFEKYSINCVHSCDKILKEPKSSLSYVKESENKFEDVCLEYIYQEKSSKMVIEICFYNFLIYINNLIYRCPNNDITVNDIADAISIVTRTKKDSNRYDTFVFKFLHQGEEDNIKQNDECFDYIVDNLIDLIPERILKDSITMIHE